MKRVIKQQQEGLLIELCCRNAEFKGTNQAELCPEIQRVVDEFEDIFQFRSELPSKRDQDHAIVLKDGITPIRVRLYHYPHAQKNEIERLVTEMLTAGIIQPNNNPYSSPILLVKKDGSWLFYVDYRALNQATIPIASQSRTSTSFWLSFMELAYFPNWIWNPNTNRFGCGLTMPKTVFQAHIKDILNSWWCHSGSPIFQALMNTIFRTLILWWYTSLQLLASGSPPKSPHCFLPTADSQVVCELQEMQFWAEETRIFGAYHFGRWGDGRPSESRVYGWMADTKKP